MFLELFFSKKRTAKGWATIPTINGDYSEAEAVIR